MTVLRSVRPDDLPALLALIADHAAYERAAPVPPDLGERLAPALFTDPPRLRCLVADDAGTLVGYATWTRDFATWTGRHYTHLDCLYLADTHRGRGLGRGLLDAVIAEAGDDEIQWQTPVWNTDAQRFYERFGAHPAPKVRYTLPG
ncbi:GNAT family N-acetyltransferase [Catellatospora chokoriensis]|uniref:Putative acetyltransferase n=1 Tax=Catellatospora chokoriensis TaxID=310353 RepID=A0A8J3JVS2_9ACTN|nr:GNAT family N-acetyltransferase [Catellatospora chokoriensis]GIF91956.1 putative acetyltransferase [Catellatospora chokoriensis]